LGELVTRYDLEFRGCYLSWWCVVYDESVISFG